VGRLGHALTDQDLARAGAGGDPGGQVDGPAEVVATLDDYRPGGHPDIGRRHPGLGELHHQLQG
jgi:hypothetical protein